MIQYDIGIFFLVANSYQSVAVLTTCCQVSLSRDVPCGPQTSEAEHPHQLFSAMWFVVVQRVSPVCWWS